MGAAVATFVEDFALWRMSCDSSRLSTCPQFGKRSCSSPPFLLTFITPAGAGVEQDEAAVAQPKTKLLYVTPEKLVKSSELKAALESLASRCGVEQTKDKGCVRDEPSRSANYVRSLNCVAGGGGV